MLSIFMDIISWDKEINICEFTRKFFMKQLSLKNFGKKSMNDKLGPWCIELRGNILQENFTVNMS
jgi:hypothetical protein